MMAQAKFTNSLHTLPSGGGASLRAASGESKKLVRPNDLLTILLLTCP